MVGDLPFQDSFEDTLFFGDGWCPKPGPSGNGRVDVLPNDSIAACDGNNMAVLDAPEGASVDRLDLLVDLSSCVDKELSFTYGFRNDAVDPEDSLLISVNGGGTFHPIYDLDNNAADDTCYHETLNLDSIADSHGLTLSSNSILRWQHAGNGSVVDSSDGFFLDDVSIQLANAPAGDIEMLSIDEPGAVKGDGDTVDVTIQFRNAGNDTIASTNLQFQYGNQTPVQEFWGGCLGSGDTVSYTFSTSLVRDSSTESLCTWSAMPNDQMDQDLSNDSLCFSEQAQSLADREKGKASFKLYPNPAQERVTIRYEELPEEANVQLLDLNGRVVRSYQVSKGSSALSLKGLEQGLYIVRSLDGNGRSIGHEKLMVR